MGRTATNVTGQALVAAVVAKRAGILDEKIWDAARDGVAPEGEPADSHAAPVTAGPRS